jgi:basic membrane lipoprotein Med (substrate-binding protein (PBP1-ABC) superfamily)
MNRIRARLSTSLHMSVFALAALVGCGKSTSETTTAMKVALLTPGPISDQSWNGGAYAGLQRIKDSLHATVSHIQTKTPADFEENFRQYGAQGYALVFGHGFEFKDAAVRVGPEYPKTIYVISSADVAQAPNVAGIQFAFADASYLAGLVAGAMTRTRTVGVIGGTEIPPVRESFDAFTAGVHAVSPKAKVIRAYIGNWDDVSAGKEQALAQINQGADVIFQNADAAGLGVFQAARESKGTLVIGSNSNQNAVAPEITLGSVVIDLPHAFLTIARTVADKTFKPEPISLGTSSQVVMMVMNPAMGARVPATIRQRVDSLQREMFAGRYHAPHPPVTAR